MRVPPTYQTRKKFRRHAKYFARRLAYLDKQFDLGFITEEQFRIKKHRSAMRCLETDMAHWVLIQAQCNRIIRQLKSRIIRKKQAFLVLLAEDLKKDADKSEKYINELEGYLKRLKMYRKEIRQQIKYLKKLQNLLSDFFPPPGK